MRTYLILLLAAVATVALLFVLPLLPGAPSVDALVPADELTFAHKAVDAVRRNDAATVESISQPETAPPPAQLAEIAATFPKAQVVHAAVTGYSRKLTTGAPTLDRLTIRYEYADHSAMRAELVVLPVSGGAYVLAGGRFNYLPAAAARTNDFAFPPLLEARTGLLALAVAIDFFVFATFGLCAAGLGPRWRWRWLILIAILVGVVRVNIDWMTGGWIVFPATVLLPPAGFYRFSLDEPWVLSLSFPLGAVLFWAFVGRWRALRDARASHFT